MADFWQELERRGRTRLVLLAPHPDDEIFGLGGTMALAVRRGLDLTILAVTDGEASHARSTAIAPAALVERRLGETQRAYAALGIDPTRVRLGLPDAGVCEQRLRDLLLAHLDDAAALLAPMPDDGHPDHDATGRAARAVAERTGVPCFNYPVWAYHRAPEGLPDRACGWRVCLSPEVVEAKRQAMTCFVSQFVPLGPAPEDGPVLPPDFRAPFERPYEVLYA